MNGYLISCCNTGRLLSEFGLVVYNEEYRDKPFTHLDLSETGLDFNSITGFTGICKIPDGYAVATQGNPNGILFLDENLCFLRYQSLGGYYDIHSMLWHGSELLFAATACNEIRALDLQTGQHRLFWGIKNKRNLHLNTFLFHQDRLLVLLHQNPTFSENERGAGVVLDAESNQHLIENLWHPHDLVLRPNGELVVLSSGERKIYAVDLEQGGDSRLDWHLDGYVRGYHEEDGQALVGISAVRMFSRKQGADKRYFRGSFEEYYNDPVFQSFVARARRGSDEVSYLPFSHMNFEIYEIKPLPGSVRPPLVQEPNIRRHMICRWLLSEE